MSEFNTIIESNKDEVLRLDPISLNELMKKLIKQETDIKLKIKKKGQYSRDTDTSQRTNKKEKQAQSISTKKLVKAAKKNIGKQYELGIDYYFEEKYSKAYTWFFKAAYQGHLESQFALGNSYY